MVVNYNVVDIASLYEGIPKKQMYIVLSRDPQNANCPRKIMISKKRILNVNYFEDEEVKVLVWDKEVEKYEYEEVLIKGGKYRVNSIVNMLFYRVRNLDFYDLGLVIDFFRAFTEVLTITDHAIISKGFDSELKALTDIKVKDTNLLLKKVKYRAWDRGHIESLFNKCICGEDINLDDLQPIVDDVENDRKMDNVSIEFNNMIFEVIANKKIISVQLLMGSQDETNEKVSFTIPIGNVGGMVFFLLLKMAEIESVEDKIKFLAEKVIY